MAAAKLIGSALLFVVVTACGSVAGTTASQEATPVPTAAAEANTPTPVPSATPIPPTAIPFPSATATPPPTVTALPTPSATPVPTATQAAPTPIPAIAATAVPIGELPRGDDPYQFNVIEPSVMDIFHVERARSLDGVLELLEWLGTDIGDARQRGSACFDRRLRERAAEDPIIGAQPALSPLDDFDDQRPVKERLYEHVVLQALLDCVDLRLLHDAYDHVSVLRGALGASALPDINPAMGCVRARQTADEAVERERFLDDLRFELSKAFGRGFRSATSISFGCRQAIENTRYSGLVDERCFGSDVSMRALFDPTAAITHTLTQPCGWVGVFVVDGFHPVLAADGAVGWVSAAEVERSQPQADTERVDLRAGDGFCFTNKDGALNRLIRTEPSTDAPVAGEVHAWSCGLRWDGVETGSWMWVTSYAEGGSGGLIEVTGWVQRDQVAPRSSMNSPEAIVLDDWPVVTCDRDATTPGRASCRGSSWYWNRATSACNSTGVGQWSRDSEHYYVFELGSDGQWEIAEEQGGLSVSC